VSVGIPEERVGACLNALFLTDPQVDRESLISAKGTRVDGTCEWILQNESYRSWVHGETPLLWISGGPGKGKTMLSIFLTEDQRITQQSEGTELIFYFCSHQDKNRNSGISILRGLLYQIIRKRQNLAKHVLPCFETPEKALQTLSSLEALWIIFRALLQDTNLGPMFCVLDGLDE
jgi:Cdc6-like AAA superfamily ATPase